MGARPPFKFVDSESIGNETPLEQQITKTGLGWYLSKDPSSNEDGESIGPLL